MIEWYVLMRSKYDAAFRRIEIRRVELKLVDMNEMLAIPAD